MQALVRHLAFEVGIEEEHETKLESWADLIPPQMMRGCLFILEVPSPNEIYRTIIELFTLDIDNGTLYTLQRFIL